MRIERNLGIYAGEMDKGKLHGFGIAYGYYGSMFVGQWVNGEIVKGSRDGLPFK